jgi:hypothetical protein
MIGTRHGDEGPQILVPELIQNASTGNSPTIEPSHRPAEAMAKHFASVTGQNLSTYLAAGPHWPVTPRTPPARW